MRRCRNALCAYILSCCVCVCMFKHLRKICLKNMIHSCIYSVSQSMYVSQRGTIEPDGFQADTEDDDEEDCVITSTQPGE